MLTVLLATRNRSQLLSSVLESFCQLRSPTSGWKLVVADNGSTDHTGQVIASFRNRLPLQCLTERKIGKNAALNAGLAFVEGDLIVFTDDDVFPHEDWLIQLRKAVDSQPDFSMFGGSIIARWEISPPSWVRWVPQGPSYSVTDPQWKEGPIDPSWVWGPNMAIRTNALQAGIRFDPYFGPRPGSYPQGGETELTRRLHSLGHKSWHVRAAVVEHFVRKEQLNTAWVMRRAICHGRGEFLIRHRYLQEISSRRLLWGAPRYLYHRLYYEARAMIRASLQGKQEEAVFRSRWMFNFIRGQIQEARTLSQSTKA
jgi:L-malate glycosyltransferase